MKPESLKYNDFLYKRNHQNRLTPVIVEHTKKKPESLYKFYGLSKQNVEAVGEGYLHASHPFDLNDILDNSLRLFFASKPIDFERYESLYGGDILNKHDLDNFFKSDTSNPPFCKRYISNMWETMTNMYGIISMTEIQDNTF